MAITMLRGKPLVLLIFGNSKVDHLKGVTKEREYLPDLFIEKNEKYGFELKVIGYSEREKVLEFIDENMERIFLLYFSGHSGSNQLLVDDGSIYREGLVKKISKLVNLKFVFFNGCANKRIIDDLAMTGTTANLLGSRTAIDDNQAAFFAKTLFKSLVVLGETIEEAYDKATDSVLSVRKNQRSLEIPSSGSKSGWYALFKVPGWSYNEFAGFCERIPKLATKDHPFPSKPFKGILSYEESDAQIFFGRCEEIHTTLEFLRSENQALVIQGQSGTGKSSLINAGIAPRVRSLGYKISMLNVRNYQFREDDNDFKGDEILIFDQLEQLLTDKMERIKQDFYKFLGSFFEKNTGGKVILSIRTEYYGRFSDDLTNLVSLHFSSFILKPLSLEKVVEVIEGAKSIARHDNYQTVIQDPEKGLKLSEIVAYDLIEDDRGRVDGSKNIAPVLQMILYDLYQQVKNKTERVIDTELYYAIKREGIGIIEQIHKKMLRIELAQSWGEEAHKSGLIIDVLYFHINDDQDAIKIYADALAERYHHIPFINELIQELVNDHLLIRVVERDGSPAFTIISHDTFCKYICQLFSESGKPGQVARKAINYAVNNNRSSDSDHNNLNLLNSSSIKRIKHGAKGTYDWHSDNREKELVDLSIRALRKKRIVRAPLYALPILILSLLGFLFPDSLISDKKYREVQSLYKSDNDKSDTLFLEKQEAFLEELFNINDSFLFESHSKVRKYAYIVDIYVKNSVILLEREKHGDANDFANKAIRFGLMLERKIGILYPRKKGKVIHDTEQANYYNLAHAHALKQCITNHKDEVNISAIKMYKEKIDSKYFELSLLSRESCFIGLLATL